MKRRKADMVEFSGLMAVVTGGMSGLRIWPRS
jgi:hypothetical protein